jgi:hypothetical protein
VKFAAVAPRLPCAAIIALFVEESANSAERQPQTAIRDLKVLQDRARACVTVLRECLK